MIAADRRANSSIDTNSAAKNREISTNSEHHTLNGIAGHSLCGKRIQNPTIAENGTAVNAISGQIAATAIRAGLNRASISAIRGDAVSSDAVGAGENAKRKTTSKNAKRIAGPTV